MRIRILAALALAALFATVAYAQLSAPTVRIKHLNWRISSSAVTYDSVSALIGGTNLKPDTTEAFDTSQLSGGLYRGGLTPNQNVFILMMGGTASQVDSIMCTPQLSDDGLTWVSTPTATYATSGAGKNQQAFKWNGFAAGGVTSTAEVASGRFVRFIVNANAAAKKLLNAMFYVVYSSIYP